MAKRYAKVAGIVLAAALAVGSLCGCMGSQEAAQQAQQQTENRAYMTSASQAMALVQEDLDAFAAAVSAGDVSAMRAAATDASAEIDAFLALKAPEALADIKKSYDAGVTQLRLALEGYMDAYANPAAADFAQKVQAVQQQYNEGIAALKAGDEKAASME